MIQELGQRVPDADDNPIVDGAVTFGSFMFFGSLPLWPYCIFLGTGYSNYNGERVGFHFYLDLLYACILTAISSPLATLSVIHGISPLFPYLSAGMFGICIGVTVLCLFMLGALQARIIKQSWIKQGLLMSLNGSLAGESSLTCVQNAF